MCNPYTVLHLYICTSGLSSNLNVSELDITFLYLQPSHYVATHWDAFQLHHCGKKAVFPSSPPSNRGYISSHVRFTRHREVLKSVSGLCFVTCCFLQHTTPVMSSLAIFYRFYLVACLFGQRCRNAWQELSSIWCWVFFSSFTKIKQQKKKKHQGLPAHQEIKSQQLLSWKPLYPTAAIHPGICFCMTCKLHCVEEIKKEKRLD